MTGEPVGASGVGFEHPAKQCPFCGSRDTVQEADCSTSLMVSLHYCRACRSPFEAIKWGDPPAPNPTLPEDRTS